MNWFPYASLFAFLLVAPCAYGEEAWISLFDGKSLGQWKATDEYTFAKHGRVAVAEGRIDLAKGDPATGIRFGGQFPTTNYELSLEAMRTGGDDFFCGLTFPVEKSHCTLIVGGWHGSVVGLSNVNDMAAVENETTTAGDFKNDQWYKIRLRVSRENITVWIDGQTVIELPLAERKLGIWWEQEPLRPLGIATWETSAALRNLKWRKCDTDPRPRKAK